MCVYKRERAGVLVVECDGCQQWYHAKCVNLQKKEVEKMVLPALHKELNYCTSAGHILGFSSLYILILATGHHVYTSSL